MAYTPWAGGGFAGDAATQSTAPTVAASAWCERIFAGVAAESEVIAMHGFSTDPWGASLGELRARFSPSYAVGLRIDPAHAAPRAERSFAAQAHLLTWKSQASIEQALDLRDASVQRNATGLTIVCARNGAALALHCADEARCDAWVAALCERGAMGEELATAIEGALPTAGLRAALDARITAVASALRSPPEELPPSASPSASPSQSPALRAAMASAVRMEVWLHDGEWGSSDTDDAEDRYTLRLLLLLSALGVRERARAIDAAAAACDVRGVVARAHLAAAVCGGTRVQPRPDAASVERHITWLRTRRACFAASEAPDAPGPEPASFLEVVAVTALCVIEARERQLELLLLDEGGGRDAGSAVKLSKRRVEWIVRAFGLNAPPGWIEFFAKRDTISESELLFVLNEYAFEAHGGPFLLPTRK